MVICYPQIKSPKILKWEIAPSIMWLFSVVHVVLDTACMRTVNDKVLCMKLRSQLSNNPEHQCS